MAIYHFTVKVVSRAAGGSAVAAAAYRSASKLYDDRIGRMHNYSAKSDVVHSEIILTLGAPEAWRDRATLWNAVEAGEKRKDAQMARAVELSIPRELNQAEAIELARNFVEREFVDRGMVADLNVHWRRADDGSPKPYVHLMLAMRSAGPDGFGRKQRNWNSKELLKTWRESWAEHANNRLAERGIAAKIDHRTLNAQGVTLEPQNKVGPAGARRAVRGEESERAAEHRDISGRNGERIITDPSVALRALTRQLPTFTRHDLACFVHRHSNGPEQFQRVINAIETAPEFFRLGRDEQGHDRFTTREMTMSTRTTVQGP